jgi:O-acetyl-ADP-ribose deacetylase (regulator of RNase III)
LGGCETGDAKLTQGYRLAEHGAISIAFPSISTGIYGYPMQRAAPVAIQSVRQFVYGSEKIQEVIFCCFSSHDLAVYEGLLGEASV